MIAQKNNFLSASCYLWVFLQRLLFVPWWSNLNSKYVIDLRSILPSCVVIKLTELYYINMFHNVCKDTFNCTLSIIVFVVSGLALEQKKLYSSIQSPLFITIDTEFQQLSTKLTLAFGIRNCIKSNYIFMLIYCSWCPIICGNISYLHTKN